MKRTILAVVVTCALAPMAHATTGDLDAAISNNIGDLQSLQSGNDIQTVRDHWSAFVANVLEQYDPLKQTTSTAEGRAIRLQLEDVARDYGLVFRDNKGGAAVDNFTPKAPLVSIPASVLTPATKPAQPISTTEEALAHAARYSMRPVHNPDTQEHIEEMAHNPLYSSTAQGQKASAILEQQAKERLAAIPAREVQDDSDVSAIEKVEIAPLTFIQPVAAPAPVAAPVDVVDHAQVQSIKENIAQVIKMSVSEQPGSPVYIALQQKLTDLSSQLKSAQSAIPATTLVAAKPPVVYVDEQPKGEEPRQPHEVPDQTVKASELTPAKPDDRTGKIAFNQRSIDQIALTKVKYASANNPEVNAAELTPADKPQEAKETIPASTLTPATKPADKPQDVIPASTLTPATKPAATVDNSTQAHLDNNVPESVKVNARLTNLEKAAAQAKPAVTTNDPAQVVNNYTISGMTAKQAAQQQDNTDQILSHSRAIASNRDAIQQNSQKIDRLQSQQDTDRKAAKAGTANALAVSGLHYVDTDNSIAIGAGTYEGQNAGSIGYRHKFSQNVAATIAASQDSNGGTGAAASLAVGW
ncbi:hypothetical protein IS360_003588 [Salmonella enterica]|nr:hypothetical protein [Salmonella enterica]